MTKKGKISSKKVLNILFWALVCSFVVFVLPSVSNRESSVICSNIHINIEPDTGLYFVEEQDVKNMLKEAMGETTVLGEKKENLQTHKMEELIRANPFVKRAQVFTNLDGDLFVELEQKNPIARVINRKGQSFYLCKDGEKIPFSPSFTPRVIAITGYLNETIQDSLYVKTDRMKSVLTLVKYIESNPFWKAQCEQLYVDKYGRLNLIPKIGNHTIVVGSAEGIEEKFSKLMTFYKSGLSKVGWNNYKIIDLRFKDQVVGKKRIID
jgi:cell division protein FtsQ